MANNYYTIYSLKRKHQSKPRLMLTSLQVFFYILMFVGLLALVSFWLTSTNVNTFWSKENISTSESVDQPVFLEIKNLNISAPTTELGLNPDSSLEVPKDPNVAGWYKYGAVPGEEGAAVIVGHLDSATGPALFYDLKKIKVGDEIVVERSDKSKAVFKTESIEQFLQNSFPTEKVYGKVNYPALRLITCIGRFNEKNQTYSHNLIVFASLVRIETELSTNK